MKLDLTKEQCLRLADAEGNHEIGAGRLAADPVPQMCAGGVVQTWGACPVCGATSDDLCKNRKSS